MLGKVLGQALQWFDISKSSKKKNLYQFSQNYPPVCNEARRIFHFPRFPAYSHNFYYHHPILVREERLLIGKLHKINPIIWIGSPFPYHFQYFKSDFYIVFEGGGHYWKLYAKAKLNGLCYSLPFLS